MSLVFPVFGIHHAHELGAEIGIPDLPILIDDDVVRQRVLARQVVFRDHHLGGAALGPRQRLERIFDRLRIAQRDARQEFRGRLGGVAGDDRPLAARAGKQRLRMGRRAAGRIARHAQEHLLEFGGIVVGGQHALERVAAHAHRQKGLLLVGAGKAEQPLATGELRHQALDLAELEIRPALAARRDIDRLSAVEPVADRADRNRVLAGLQPRAREAVRALLVAHHGRGDARAVLLGAHQHAFHRSLVGRGDDAGERGLRLRVAADRS